MKVNLHPGRSFQLLYPVIFNGIQDRIRSEPNKSRSIRVGARQNPDRIRHHVFDLGSCTEIPV